MDYPISTYDNYTLQYKDRMLKFKYHQVTTKWIGKVFGLSPGSILPFTDEEGQLETPDDNGNFHLEERKVYKVQGEPIPTLGVGNARPSMFSSQPPALPPTPTGIVATSALPFSYPYPLVNQPTSHKKSKRFRKAPEPSCQEVSVGWRKNIELHECNKTTGELRKTSNYPLFLSASSASLNYITDKLSAECYSNNEVVLLDNDNFEIPSKSCTQDPSFWKGSRRIKAVTKSDYTLLFGGENESDDENFMPSPIPYEANIRGYKYSWMAVSTLLFT
uniref:Uncharacterized protein n=1 Tax=Amphimedon queenslandica TaxID=400682 RepID=A0A1X7VG24_AMPQE